MRQYELTIRIAQIHHLIEVRKYKKALAVVKTLDMRQVKGISDLSAIAEVYTKTEQFDAAKNTYLRIYKRAAQGGFYTDLYILPSVQMH